MVLCVICGVLAADVLVMVFRHGRLALKMFLKLATVLTTEEGAQVLWTMRCSSRAA